MVPPDDSADPDDASVLLEQMRAGDPAAASRLYSVLYRQLKSIARGKMASDRPDHTLQATALVNEAWLRLTATGDLLQPESRAHFLRIAARAMRAILVDHARGRGAEKRGAGAAKVPLDDALAAVERGHAVGALVVDETLSFLREHDPRLADVVEMRYFGGLTEDETAEALSLTRRQVQHAWKLARAWLQRAVERGESKGD